MERVEKLELNGGDHIYVYCIERDVDCSRHGIYVGEGKVVHFTRDPKLLSLFAKTLTTCSTCEAFGPNKHEGGVRISCLDCFLGDGSSSLFRFHYVVGNTGFVLKMGDSFTLSSGKPCDSAEVAIERAMTLLENGSSDKFNSCGDFASYCKTGFVREQNIERDYEAMLRERHGILYPVYSWLMRRHKTRHGHRN